MEELTLKQCESCLCMKNMHPTAQYCKRCTCGALVHTRGWAGSPGPITCAEKKTCKMHSTQFSTQNKTQEGLNKHKLNCKDNPSMMYQGYDDCHCFDSWTSKFLDAGTQLVQLDLSCLIGTVSEIITQIREEEREKVAREIGEEILILKKSMMGPGGHGNCCMCLGCKHYHEECTCSEVIPLQRIFEITQKYYSHEEQGK